MPSVSPLPATAARRSPRGGGGVGIRRDTSTVASRVSSTTFVGRHPELTELEAGLADAREGKASIAFVAGESGVGKTRLLGELERAARESGMRVLSGECIELGEGELPYAPIVAALRPLARSGDPALDALTPAARLRRPRAGRADARRPRRPRPHAPGPRREQERAAAGGVLDRAGAPLRGPARALRAARPRGRAAAHDRGPPLGRPLDALVPRLSRVRAVPREGARGHQLPPGRAAPPPSAAPAPRRAGPRPRRGPGCWPGGAGPPAGAGSSSAPSRRPRAPGAAPRSAAPSRTRTCSPAC